MTSTFETMAPNSIRFANYKPTMHEMACPVDGVVPLHRFLLLMIVACSMVVLFGALANAQESVPGAQNAGWWSPETQSARAPHLMIGMADLNRFESSGLLNATSPAKLNLTPSGDAAAGFENTGSMLNARVAQQALWVEPTSMPATTFLSLVETRYATWESSLSDTRGLTNVNGMSVYPIFQVNYGSAYVPVTLYISPLRGSNVW